MHNEPSKSIKNSLFNPNVTGSTYEDFAQHATLFPAQEPAAPVYDPNSEQTTISSDFTIEPGSGQFGEVSIEDQAHLNISEQYQSSFEPLENIAVSQQQPTSNISSLLSSFSNIWKQSPVPQPEIQQQQLGNQEKVHETTITTDYFQPYPNTSTSDIQPQPEIALYSPSDLPIPAVQVPPPPTGATNTYRRSGLKRAVYAPVPGLSTVIQSPTALLESATPVQTANSFETKQQSSFPITNYFLPTTSSVSQEASRPTTSVSPKQFVRETVESNSPFLSPVQDLSSLPAPDPFVGLPTAPSMSTMPTNQPSNNLPYAYRQDNFLPTTNTEVINATYRPVYHHWFYKKNNEGRGAWEAFSMHDSQNLEAAFTSTELSPETVVATDGGRYDVNILRRERLSVYWKSDPTEVKRCSWFHKGSSDGRYVPFDENIAAKLEEEYKNAFETNQWQRKIDIQNGETVVLHGVDVLVLFPAMQSPDAWGNTPQNQPRPRVVKRGMDEFDIDEGESETVDHVLFMVHGIGAACDLKFRSVEEVVDEFRTIALQLVRAHYRSSCDKKIVNRVEILPISWHEKLHSEDTGIDKKLKSITLESIPKLREFTNDTLLDILFYTSPVYGQTIISSVSNELNSIYSLFKKRNPTYKGGVSLGGHSLGSLILFDILRNQNPPSEKKTEAIENSTSSDDSISSIKKPKPHPMNRSMSRRFSYMLGTVGTGQPEIMYPQLSFQPHTFFALGSPIGMFVTVRGLDTLGETFKFPTCPGFFNIFHPYDPVAYRVESLVNEKLADIKPVLIPHHKGRKRMHLELKDTMTRVGADIKQKLIDSMKSTWNSIFQMGWANNRPQIQPNLEAEVDKVIQEGFSTGNKEDTSDEQQQNEKTELCLGLLNEGRRIDYVLQEAPVEFFNEYIFTLSSHLCYWESEDTILMMLKEIYRTLNVSPDNQIPQQTMTIERPPLSPNSSRSPYLTSPPVVTTTCLGVDPTLPINKSTELGPPPVSGFVRKS